VKAAGRGSCGWLPRSVLDFSPRLDQARGGGSSGRRVCEAGCETLSDAGHSGTALFESPLLVGPLKQAELQAAIWLHSCDAPGVHGWRVLAGCAAPAPVIPGMEDGEPPDITPKRHAVPAAPS
jgi:hypothetical protein